MDINFVTVSKLSSEIIDRDTLTIENLDKPVLSELHEKLYDKYRGLWLSGDYKIFWQYSRDLFVQINDYLSYLTALRCMSNKTFYVLLDDFDEIWEDNLSYLLDLDRIEEEKRIQKDIYDVISKKEEDLTAHSHATQGLSRRIRSESEILCYAIRKEPVIDCFTTDTLQRCTLIADIQKGYPKVKVKLRVAPDVEFEKRGPRDGKGKKGKTSKTGTDKKGKAGKGKKKK